MDGGHRPAPKETARPGMDLTDRSRPRPLILSRAGSDAVLETMAHTQELVVPVRLRYLAHDLEVPEGQFAIGRSSDCQLSLDDPLVSRRHAVLVVRGDSVEVEDLGSRNGVLVNGVRVEKPTRLVDGDILTVGQQQLTIAGAQPAATPPPARPPSRPNVPRISDGDGDEGDAGTTEDETRFHLVPKFRPDQPDKRVHALSLIGAVADKALALGHPDEAERLLRRPLESLLERIRTNPDAAELRSGAVVARAGELALRLATATESPDWIHYLLDLYAARGEPLPPPILDALYEVVRKVRIDVRRLRAYVEGLHKAPRLGPSDRFLVSRIEGLERVAALK